MNAIEIRNMTKIFPGFSINDLSLDIAAGCITGIVGRNGAGKSTLIKALIGAMPIDNGQITVLGKDLLENEIEIKEELGVSLDDGRFYRSITTKAMKNMVRPFYKNWDEALFDSYMQRFSIPYDRKTGNLSKGMRAKFSIALALSHHPKILVMDEPSSGLDPMARGELLDIITETMEREDITVLISTHITSDLDRTADYIVVMDNGQITLSGEKDAVIDSHRLVKGGELTRQLEQYLVGWRKGRYGFEGLTARGADVHSRFPSCVLEKPVIEDIMRFYSRKDEDNA